jgi:DNA-binding response OmpR family regulator
MNHPYALVIEDDPKLSTIYVDALKQAGFEIALDSNGNQYDVLLSTKPDLVILDLHLPFASGVDILNDLRARYPTMVIIVVTADFIKAKSLPVTEEHVLIKPVSVARLLKIAESVKIAP